ncbi:hypothetical protein SBDP1_60003 [Syntrophobacter sp. SbD1]|nr:hypothetical protein SBDP1_60003 [Syntrophobacter sp. SbD1]
MSSALSPCFFTGFECYDFDIFIDSEWVVAFGGISKARDVLFVLGGLCAPVLCHQE